MKPCTCNTHYTGTRTHYYCGHAHTTTAANIRNSPFYRELEVRHADSAVVCVDCGAGVRLLDEDGGRLGVGGGEPHAAVTVPLGTMAWGPFKDRWVRGFASCVCSALLGAWGVCVWYVRA